MLKMALKFREKNQGSYLSYEMTEIREFFRILHAQALSVLIQHTYSLHHGAIDLNVSRVILSQT